MQLMHPFGFIIKKFVTMHGHMNVKFGDITFETPFVVPPSGVIGDFCIWGLVTNKM